MYSADSCPIEDLVGKPVLEISEARHIGCVLELREIYHEFRSGLTSGLGKDCRGLQQSIGNRIGEVGPFDSL
jgi:hypothetical protein